MKIYVDDELPKNCKECPLYRSGRLKVKKGARYIDAETCVLGNFYKLQEIDDEIDTCPLETTQSLKQQVREEVVEEIKKFANSIFTRYEKRELDDVAYGKLLCCDVLIKKLGGVKRENNVKD